MNEARGNRWPTALLAHGGDPAHKLFVKEAHEAAERYGMHFQPLVVKAPEEIESAFTAMGRERAGALIVQPLFINNLGQGGRLRTSPRGTACHQFQMETAFRRQEA